jgi:protein tyrosine/serine phosphatase
MRNRVALALVAMILALLSGCQNLPHEEGKPVNFGVVTENAVFRGGEPETQQEWQYLKSIGVKTVVKLNKYSGKLSEEDEDRYAKENGITVIKDFMQPEDAPHNFNFAAQPDHDLLAKAVKDLSDAQNGPVYVHCSHGQDRTGLVVALYRMRVQDTCKSSADTERAKYLPNHLPGVEKVLNQEPDHCSK